MSQQSTIRTGIYRIVFLAKAVSRPGHKREAISPPRGGRSPCVQKTTDPGGGLVHEEDAVTLGGTQSLTCLGGADVLKGEEDSLLVLCHFLKASCMRKHFAPILRN